MITFNGQTKYARGKTQQIKKTIKQIIKDHGYRLRRIDYIFINDEELLEINKQSLNHDFYTDIISFDYTEDKTIEGEIYISIDRVLENAKKYNQEFHVELLRVIFHGVLHYVGYKDKKKPDAELMRKKEEYYINIHNNQFHVEHVNGK